MKTLDEGLLNAPHEDLARVLALLIASKGYVNDAEWRVLEADEACPRLGIGMARFTELVERCTQEIGANLREHRWLDAASLTQIDDALTEITAIDERLLVCQLAAHTLNAGNERGEQDTLVLDHALGRWHLTGAMLAQQR